jgi:hypothetical protein
LELEGQVREKCPMRHRRRESLSWLSAGQI